jgi:hypothetical protein
MARLFLIGLLAATLMPAIFIALSWWAPMRLLNEGIWLMSILASVHVPLTLYLASDCDVRAKLAAQPINCIFVPLIIFVLVLGIFMFASVTVVLSIAVIFLHYQAFHFGRQNVGVYAMASMATAQGPVLRSERLTINAATACGMLGTMSTFMPNLMVGEIYPVDNGPIAPVASALYYVGLAFYVGTLVCACVIIVMYRQRYKGLSIFVYLGSVLFFLPTYLSHDFLFSFLSYGIAHGLQYDTILGFHALNADRSKVFLLKRKSVLIFLAVIAISFVLYGQFAQVINITSSLTDAILHHSIAHQTQARFVLAFMVATAAAHFWFDQNVWRFREPARRKWLFERFPFLRVGADTYTRTLSLSKVTQESTT